MSPKSLDQIARSGAFHHLIRSAQRSYGDTGLQDLRDGTCHIFSDYHFLMKVFLDLDIRKQLKEIKELNNQLCDWLPETDSMRKFPTSTVLEETWV